LFIFVVVKLCILYLFFVDKTLESLPKAQQPEARKLTPVELKRLREQEETTLRELRLFLRDVINKLGRDRKFAMFAKPVDIEDVIIIYITYAAFL